MDPPKTSEPLRPPIAENVALPKNIPGSGDGLSRLVIGPTSRTLQYSERLKDPKTNRKHIKMVILMRGLRVDSKYL
jgi:hypothetical protein